MALTKTDNAYLRDKLQLRADHLPSGDIRVLDCFCGKGILWAGVEKMTNRKITTLPIDTRDDIDFFHLAGNNSDFLTTLNLSKFNVIDLDAYGVPYEQLKIIFERGYQGTVFVTFIQSIMGIMPMRLFQDVGFSEEMIKKSPTLFCKRGWEYFLQWLAAHGVTEIYHRSHARKHYLGFNCAGRSGADCNILPEGMAANRV
jgi:hypothetical protein